MRYEAMQVGESWGVMQIDPEDSHKNATGSLLLGPLPQEQAVRVALLLQDALEEGFERGKEEGDKW